MLEVYDVVKELNSLRNAYAAGLPVSEAAKRVVEVMVGMSLATQSRLAAALRRTTADLQAPLAELREKGLVTSVVLGSAAAGSKPAERLYFTDLAIEQFGDLPVTWHEAGNRAALLDRLPVVDACYLAATAIDRYGRFLEFRWLDGVGLSAVARYEHGWVGLIWSGMLETVTELDARFGRLAADISSLAVGWESHPWPGILAAVVPDPWQRELVLNAARRWGLDGQVATWCISDGSRTGASTEGVSRGWIHQEVAPREIGNWAWDDRVQSSIWAQLRTPFLYRVFRIIAEYPGINRRMTQRMLGEAPGGTSTKQCIRTLIRLNLVEELSDRDIDGRNRSASATKKWLCLSPRGIDRLARMERGTATAYRGAAMAQSWIRKPRRKKHELGAAALMADCRWAGLSTAAGWRYYDGMGSRGAVVPDGMVYLTRCPYGAGWAFLEYERAARSPSKVHPKLKNYWGPTRRMDRPLLVVCWNDTAESNFHDIGGDGSTRMLTTTISRLDEHGPLGNFECWSFYGQKVQIG